MILKNLNCSRSRQHRRSAFTLLEVLVVVAILVVLASISSIYMFRYLEDAKIDKARIQAKTLETAAKSYVLRNDISTLSLQALISPPGGGKPFVEGGSEALQTGFGGQFQLEMGSTADNSEQNIIVYFKGPDGRTYYSNGKIQ